MWVKTHSIVVSGIERQQIWQVWSDINNRPAWDLGTEWPEQTALMIKIASGVK